MASSASTSLQARPAMAKPETVDKIWNIVKKHLTLPEDSGIMADSTFQALGADCFDTGEIVYGLEQEFGIDVEDESAARMNTLTVRDAAELIEARIRKNKGIVRFIPEVS